VPSSVRPFLSSARSGTRPTSPWPILPRTTALQPHRRRADGRSGQGRAPRPGRALACGHAVPIPDRGKRPARSGGSRGKIVGPAPLLQGKRYAVDALSSSLSEFARSAVRDGREAVERLSASVRIHSPRRGFPEGAGTRGPSRRARTEADDGTAASVPTSIISEQAGVPQSDRRAHAGVRDRARSRYGKAIRSVSEARPAGRWTSGCPTAGLGRLWK